MAINHRLLTGSFRNRMSIHGRDVHSETETRPYGPSGWITSYPWEGLHLVVEDPTGRARVNLEMERLQATSVDAE